MAVTLNPGSGGEVIATEDIAGTDYQQVKLVDGTAASTTVIAAGGGVEAGALRVTVASDSTGVLSVDDNGGSLTVDAVSLPLPTGAATAAAQLPDGHNVTVDNASGASAVNIQDGGNSITVDATSLPLPTGAATSANQTTGNASLATIAGAVSGTEMQVDIVSGAVAGTEYTEDAVVPANPQGPAMVAERDDALSTLTPAAGDWTHLRTDSQGALWVNAVNADGTNNIGTAAGATDSGVPILAVRDDALTTLTDPDGDYVPIRVNSTGAIHVTGGGGGTEYNVSDAGPTVVTMAGAVRDDTLTTLTEVDGDATLLRVNSTGALHVTDSAGNVATLDGNTIDLGNGAVGAGTQRVTIASDTTGVLSVDDNGGSLTVDGSVSLAAAIPAGTNNIGDVDIASALPAGTNNIGDVDIASAIPAGANVIGDVGISGARTSGGTTIFRSIDLDETEEQIKGTAGQVYWLHCMNMAATVRYLKFYNATAATVVVGTTTPVMTFPIPTQGDTNGAGFMLPVPNGIEFGTAITVAATTGIADADTGAPGANEVILNLGYA